MRYYIIAGEASGDLHAANLVKEIQALDPQAELRGIGGDGMRLAGVDLVRHYRDTAYMGFLEVLLHLRKILAHIRFCKNDIAQWKPDVLILVDYPGFNLRIAPFAHDLGIQVSYYISPQLWAWKSSRVEIIKKYVHQLLVILPFEEKFYAQYQYPVTFVGHPLLDAIHQFKPDETFLQTHQLNNQKYIAILPGSRKQEIRVKLPIMLSVIDAFPEYAFVVACAPGLDPEFYKQFSGNHRVQYIQGATYQILQHAHAALVTSGTATLETALFRVPQIVCYKGSAISYHIAKRLVHIKYISLVNLIADKEVVPELIQHALTRDNLISHMQQLMQASDERKTMLQEYNLLAQHLGGPGASKRAAQEIIAFKEKKRSSGFTITN